MNIVGVKTRSNPKRFIPECVKCGALAAEKPVLTNKFMGRFMEIPVQYCRYCDDEPTVENLNLS